MTETLCEIRNFKPEDKSFVCATFLRGLYYGDSWFSLMPKDLFMLNYKKVIEALLVSPNVRINIACLKDDKDIILGYSILSKDLSTVHWVFVKSAFRKQGIMKLLLPQSMSAVTHLTKLGTTLMSKFPNLIFNPFAIN